MRGFLKTVRTSFAQNKHSWRKNRGRDEGFVVQGFGELGGITSSFVPLSATIPLELFDFLGGTRQFHLDKAIIRTIEACHFSYWCGDFLASEAIRKELVTLTVR